MFLMDLKKGTPPTRITTGKNFLYSGSVYNGRVYIVTNEDAPRFRMFVTEAGEYDRDDWKEIIPQTGGVLKDAELWGGKIFAQYEQNASSELKVFDLQGQNVRNLALPAIGTVSGSGGKWDHDEIFYGFESFTVTTWSTVRPRCGPRWMRLLLILRLTRLSRSGTTRKMGHASLCFWCTRKD
jgi:prolyl oligopeptidase